MGPSLSDEKQEKIIGVNYLIVDENHVRVSTTNIGIYGLRLYKSNSNFSEIYKLLEYSKKNIKPVVIEYKIQSISKEKYITDVKKLDDKAHELKLIVKDIIEIKGNYEVVSNNGIYKIDTKTYLDDPLVKKQKYKVKWVYTQNGEIPEEKQIISYQQI